MSARPLAMSQKCHEWTHPPQQILRTITYEIVRGVSHAPLAAYDAAVLASRAEQGD
jgi:hypothetical protein